MTYRFIPVCFASLAAMVSGAVTAKTDAGPQTTEPAAVLTIYTADINPATGALLSAPTRLETALPNSWLPQYSKDGRRLAYLSSAAGTGIQEITRRPEPLLSIRSLDTGQTTSFPVRLERVFSFAWSPDGRKLVVRGADSRSAIVIHLIDVATGEMTPLAIGTPKVERYTQPHWAEDSRRVYYGKGKPGVLGEPLMERDLETGEERLLLDFSDVKTPDGAALSPRGYLISPDRRLVAALGPPAAGFRPGAAFNNPQALWVVPLDTKIGRRLKFEGFPYPLMGPAFAWTADSRAVLIISGEGPEQNARRNLWLVPIDGSAPVKLAIDPPIQNVSAAIHPNGRQVAFVSAGQRSHATASRGPTYAPGTGPMIAFDEGHQNPPSPASPALFELLRGDGYRPQSFGQRMSAASLKDVDVLVINSPGGQAALDLVRARKGKLPDEAAAEAQAASLSDDEVAAVLAWLEGGGSVLLIVDHSPYPLAAGKLTRALGIRNWPNGSAAVRTELCADQGPGCMAPDADGNRRAGTIFFWRKDFFPGGDARLADIAGAAGMKPSRGYQSSDAVLARHPITEGRSPDERIRRVVTFGGSAFEAPRDAEPLLILPRGAVMGQAPIDGWVQGAVMTIGKGRLAAFADNAVVSGGPAADNRQFVLNVMHWLSRVL